jgi:4-amino-4-deoxy-L-arabinose transferase-like glycosyltransferase
MRTAVLIAGLGRRAGLVALLAVMAATAFVIPTMSPVATTDDWGYTRSVEILIHQGKLTVFPVVAATAVFQVLWGALFAAVFGMSLGMMRVSTLVMTGFGAIALYGLLGELRVAERRRLLGVAVYLFNPLAFILAFTFMTDAHFTALMTGSTWLYVRGQRPGQARWVVAGSGLAACAFLIRQQGALIPFAVALFLLCSGRLRFDRESLRAVAAVTALPIVAVAGYYVWLFEVNDVPAVQQGFAAEAKTAGLSGTATLIRNLTFIELVYLGFFLLPLALAALPAARAMVSGLGTRGWLVLVAWLAVLDTGLSVDGAHGTWMPYVGQFVGTGGLGPPDVLGSRARLLGHSERIAITAVCAAAAAVVALALCHGFARSSGTFRSPAGLVGWVAVAQIAGVLPPSFHYLHRGYSLDRYLLPLLPLGIALFLWATREARFLSAPGWVAVACLAAISIVGTRDYLTYMDTVWSVATYANSLDIPDQHIDAGAAWDGYHLYTYGLDNGITTARTRRGPWWVFFYGKPTDSVVVVSGQLLKGYSVIAKQTYDPWWGPEDTIYLLGRPGYRVVSF